MITIFYKELSGYFSSLTAYITIGIFLIVNGLTLWVFPDSSLLDYGYAGLDSFFNLSPYIFMFLIPAITMRSFAEERKDGTLELLATRPLSDLDILMGKFLAAMSITLICLIFTGIYCYTIYQLGLPKGNMDTGAVIGSYIGLFLLAAAYTSIGLFASSLGKNQIVAFSVAVFLSFIAFSGFDSASRILSLQFMESGLAWLGINEHYRSISRGVLDTRDLIYFLSFTALFLVLSKTIIGARKW